MWRIYDEIDRIELAGNLYTSFRDFISEENDTKANNCLDEIIKNAGDIVPLHLSENRPYMRIYDSSEGKYIIGYEFHSYEKDNVTILRIIEKGNIEKLHGNLANYKTDLKNGQDFILRQIGIKK
jgi:hypothetical protein